MTSLAVSDAGFNRVSDWVGGGLALALIATLLTIDLVTFPSRRVRLAVTALAVILAVDAAVVVVVRFVRLSV